MLLHWRAWAWMPMSAFFLHRDRAGRESLALDLMEELRPCFADRFVLTLVNNGILHEDDFEVRESGAVMLKDTARKSFLKAWQERKQKAITHPYLGRKFLGIGAVCTSIALGSLLARGSGRVSSVFMEVNAMLVVITYDVNTETAAGRKRLRQIAKQCVNYGQRVQNSVFECLLDAAQCRMLQAKLVKIMDQEADSLRFYYLGNHYENRIEHFGCKTGYEPEGVLMA